MIHKVYEINFYEGFNNMKSKQLFFATVCAVLAINVCAAPMLPKQWKANKSTISVAADGVISIKTNDKAKTAGISGVIRNLTGQRYKVSFAVKGEGKVQAALNSGGIAYSKTVKLTDQWQDVSLTYFPKAKTMIFMIYSAITNAAEFQVKDIAIAPCELPELADADIEAKLFLPADFPGENGKLYSKKDSSVGKAAWGKRWYNVMKLPVPANSKDLYYYIHAQKTGDIKCAVNLRTDSQNVYTAAVTAPANQWQWVKVGPVKAVAVYPEFYINYSVADAKTVIWVDKVVLSTNAALTDTDLDKAE